MNYEQLKTFLLVADKKSFSEAARILHLAQPTVTAHIKSLEIYLNIKLFERTNKHVHLTTAGNILYKYTKEIVKLSEQAENEILELSKTIHGNLVVACSLTIGENIIPQILMRFRNTNPLIKINVEVTNTNVILTKIRDRILDIGLIEAPIDDPNLILEPFMEDKLVLISKPNFISKKEDVRVNDLVSLPLILREKGSGTRTVMDLHLKRLGLNPSDLNIELELGSTEAVKAAVESGLGVSIVSESAVRKELQLNLLEIIPIKDIEFSRHFYVVYHRDTIFKPAVEAFNQFIRTVHDR